MNSSKDPTVSSTAAAPSFKGELLRGIHPFNLGVAFGCALAAGGISLTKWVAPLWASLIGWSTVGNAAIVAVIIFVIVTAMHTAGHAYFGWRFGKGLQAEERGNYIGAERLLRPADGSSMHHYDPHGLAAAGLERCRIHRDMLQAGSGSNQ